MIVKDRIAIGDNKYIMKQLNDGTGRIELIPSPDEVIEEGTTLNKAVLQPIFDGLDKIATVDTVVNQGKQEIQTATNQAVERISNAQPETNPKIYTVAELTEPQEGKIYNVKIEENTSTINEKPVYKENTTQSVTLKAGKVATVYYQGGNFFYKASASGNAVAENVLAGKKFSNENDTDIVGAMVNRGATIITPSTSNKYIASGYHNGSGYVVGDSDLVASNIVQGKNIFGVSGQALQYQQSEKDAIANAITSKGVPTSTTASLDTIKNNIKKIPHIKLVPISSGSLIWLDPSYSGAYISSSEFTSSYKQNYDSSWSTDRTHIYYDESITYSKYKKIVVDPSGQSYVSGEFFLVPQADLNMDRKEFANSIQASKNKIKCANNNRSGYINVPNNNTDYRLVFLCGSIGYGSWYTGAVIFAFKFPYFMFIS